MKNIPFCIVLCLSLSLFSQNKADSLILTKTEWVSKDLNYLRFFKDSVIYNIHNTKNELLFDFKNNKLIFKAKYYVGGSDIRVEDIQFKIKQLDKNKLVLVALDKKEDIFKKKYKRLDPDPFFKEKQYVFYNRGQLISRVNFKRITFHASTCFGTCPSISIEINRDGKVYYQGRVYAKEYTGNFIGKLSSDEIYSLRKIINRSQIKILDQKWKQHSQPNDTPRYNYIVEMVDGNLIEMNTNDQHPILDKLSQYFLDIPEIADLKKENEKHTFAKSNIETYRVSQN